eukprot:9487505-Karenia_brevis.AAC.1
MVENVDGMTAESSQSMSKLLECQPIFVDASYVKDARRPRLCWINSDLQWRWSCRSGVREDGTPQLLLPGGQGNSSQWLPAD